MGYLLGIDIGTSGTKTCLFCYNGELVTSAYAEYPMLQPQVGWAEQHPEDWWIAARQTIQMIFKQSKINPSDIKGIGLSGQMHGLVLLDRDGKVLRPAIIWCDQRTGKQVEWMRDSIGTERIIDLTSNTPLPNYTASKLLWVRDNEPNIYEKIHKVLLPKDYIRYKLTQEFATEVSDASGTLLLNVASRTWSSEMVELLGFEKKWLPEVRESNQISGTVSKLAAMETGLSEGTAVVGGAGDQAAGAVGNGIVKAGVISASIGTSGVVFASTDEIKKDPLGRLHSFCHAVPGKWHVMGVTQAAGGSLQWFRNHFGIAEMELAKTLQKNVYDIFTEKAMMVKPGCEGLVFLPYLMGERTPHLDSFAKGTFVGITSRHGKEHFIRSIMEGVAFSLKDCLSLIDDLKVANSEIRISGGGANSLLWRQIFADVFNQRIHRIHANEGPAFGAALLAGVGTNVYSSVEEACSQTVQYYDSVEPNGEFVERYENYYTIYKELYFNLYETFASLHKLAVR
ncbi:xylulokinase [Neobacillus drentensis]|uniref:xylulokinase n=1 Tax=Neobacillus drentensis TaxID=220684 RepID=UPI002FFEF1D3